MKHLFKSLILSGALFFLGAPVLRAEELPPVNVSVDAVKSETSTEAVSVIGRLAEHRSGVVAVRISGPVREMKVEVGDRIKADTVLAVLVTDSLEAAVRLRAAEVARADSRMKSAEAKLALARQELSRLENLKSSAAFSQAKLDDKKLETLQYEAELGETKASLESARANLKLDEINLYNASIRAPYAGVVSQRHTAEGAYLKTGDPVVSMVNDEQWEIEAEVPVKYLSGLEPGKTVPFTLGNNASKKFEAEIRAIVPDENPRTRTRIVRFVPYFTDSDLTGAALAANQSVILSLPATSGNDVPTVHKDAVILRSGKNFVFVAVNGKADLRPVELGGEIGKRREVVSGLAIGDQVIIRGNERLQPGQPVHSEAKP